MNTKMANMTRCLGFIGLACVLVACLPAPEPQEPTIITISRSSALVSREELIDQADEIFLGQIQSISSTRWNQDSGEYWEEEVDEGEGRKANVLPIAYYEIEFSIIRSIVGTPSGSLVVTAGGKSPVDDQLLVTIDRQPVLIEYDNGDLVLEVGDRLIVFVHYYDLAWRDPSQPPQRVDHPDGGYYYDPGDSRPVLGFLQEPASSLFYEREDGLYHSLENASQKWEPFSLEELDRIVGARREINAAKE